MLTLREFRYNRHPFGGEMLAKFARVESGFQPLTLENF